MEIRISIPADHVSDIFNTSYVRVEGGSWFCESIDNTRRTFNVLTRFYLAQKEVVIEILLEDDPDTITLPCWPQESQKCKRIHISDSVVNYFPHSHVLCCSLKSLDDPIVIEWLIKAGLIQEEIHTVKQEALKRQTVEKIKGQERLQKVQNIEKTKKTEKTEKTESIKVTPSFTHPKGVQVGSLCAPAPLVQKQKPVRQPVYSFVDEDVS